MKVSYYTAGGRFLASIFTDYDRTGDYQCASTNCNVAAGRGRASIMLMG